MDEIVLGKVEAG